jgi:hypothetical protein
LVTWFKERAKGCFGIRLPSLKVRASASLFLGWLYGGSRKPIRLGDDGNLDFVYGRRDFRPTDCLAFKLTGNRSAACSQNSDCDKYMPVRLRSPVSCLTCLGRVIAQGVFCSCHAAGSD